MKGKRIRFLWGLMALTALPSISPVFAEPARYSATTSYILKCAGCHAMDGRGSAAGGIPPLQLINAFTSDTKGRTYLMHVPGVVSSGLNSAEIAAVVNYIVELWGDKTIDYTPFTEAEVSQLRAVDIADVVSYRREIAELYEQEGKTVADYPWP